jgi:3'(2'), 5'-bisphosphate nucleotidase
VEALHSSHSTAGTIASILQITKDSIRMDSQCKYAVVSRGEADIYLRIPTRMDYEEKIWDHAGGSLLIEESGGKISDIYGNKLDFSQGRTLKSKGVVATNGKFHDKVIEAVKTAMKL